VKDKRVLFPGAEVDFDFLDAFEWTPELLTEYADRARALSGSVGSDSPHFDMPRMPAGDCSDCRKTVAARWPYGPHELELCERDFTTRRRIRRTLIELKAIAGEASRSGADASPAEGDELQHDPKEENT
jgi:hypothetical protein